MFAIHNQCHHPTGESAQDPDARLKLEEMLKGGGGIGGGKFGSMNVDDWLKNIRVERPGGAAGDGSSGGKKAATDDVDELLGDDLVKDHDEL